MTFSISLFLLSTSDYVSNFHNACFSAFLSLSVSTFVTVYLPSPLYLYKLPIFFSIYSYLLIHLPSYYFVIFAFLTYNHLSCIYISASTLPQLSLMASLYLPELCLRLSFVNPPLSLPFPSGPLCQSNLCLSPMISSVHLVPKPLLCSCLFTCILETITSVPFCPYFACISAALFLRALLPLFLPSLCDPILSVPPMPLFRPYLSDPISAPFSLGLRPPNQGWRKKSQNFCPVHHPEMT